MRSPRSHRLIATNQLQRRAQYNCCGAKEYHCFFVRNGPADFFLELYDVVQLNNGWGETFFLVTVGVMGGQNGVDILIRTFDSLKHEF